MNSKKKREIERGTLLTIRVSGSNKIFYVKNPTVNDCKFEKKTH